MKERELEQALSLRLGKDIRVVYTNNSRSMLTFRERSTGIFSLRLHRMFSRADLRVVEALADYLDGRANEEASARVDAFIAENLHRVRGHGRAPDIPIRPKGTFFDLGEVYDRINREYFDGAIRAAITWGRNPRVRSRQRSIRLGTYWEYPDGALIRIHPALDHSEVPRYVLERIVFHEMLHQVFGLEPGCLHPKEFSQAERRFRHYRRAINWERRNLEWLMGKRQLAFHLPTA